MSIKLQLPKLTDLRPRLMVIGVGGAGCNAVNNMIDAGLTGAEFVVANTDAQSLAASTAEHRLQLGVNLTEGLGAGAKPEIGEAAAEEALEDIRTQVAGCHMLFIAAGMGGGTGTGAAAVIARVAKEFGILTVGVVTKPFQFEGARRMRVAEAGIAELKKHVDTLIVIPNQNLFRVANEKTTFAEAFILADQVLYSGVACIIDLIVKPGLINLDFADVRAVMSGMGTAMMGTGEAAGEGRAVAAAEEAIANPLLDDVTLRGAKGLLLSITGGRDMTLYEVDEAASRVRQEVDAEANIIVGATFDDTLGDRLRVSIVASGMARMSEDAAPSRTSQALHRGAGDQGMERRLSEAMQRGEEASDTMTFAPVPMSEQPTQPPRGTWHAPGNVTIEEGLPHLSASGRPRGGDFHQPQDRAERFSPAAPVEIHRSGRRMPQVEDFPAVGQREYNAKAGGRGASGSQQKPTEARRPGLLERLTGRSRTANDSSRALSDANDSELHRESAAASPDSHRQQGSEPQVRGSVEDDEDTDRAGFFRRDHG